jgi:CRP-like cAMP-binding protein
MENNITLLLNVFFFKNLEPDELLDIMAVSRRERYSIGQRIFEAGAPSDAFYIIRSGSMMVKNGPIVLATLGVGDTIGEMSFVDHGARSATLAAIEETELLKIPFDALEKLFDEHPPMAVKVFRSIASVLSQRLREMDEHIRTKFQPLKS